MTTSSGAGHQQTAQKTTQQQHQQPQQPIYFGPFDVTNQVFLKTPHSFALVNLKPLLPGHVLVCPLRAHRRLTDLSASELTDLMVAVQRVQRMLARQYFTTTPSPSPSSPTSTSITTTTPHLAPAAEPEEGSFNIALQDGPEAGQTVPHVHVHVIPRIRGSTAKPASTPSDAVYERMANEDGNVGGALWDRALRERALNQQGQGQEVESGSAGGDGWEWGSTRPQPGGSFPSIEDAARQARSMAEMEEEAGVYKRLFEIMDAEEREGGRR